MRLIRTAGALALALGIGGCSLGGLLGGGAKGPATLGTWTQEAPAPAQLARTAAPRQAVTIQTPTTAKELEAVRVPVQVTSTDVQYVTNLQLVDMPARLFRDLVAETVRRTTNRIVLNPDQTGFDPGVAVSGVLQRFGYDAATGQVVVTYDASMATTNGSAVQSRRFTATAPADGTAATVAPALNRAANQVAQQVARWIGG